MWVAQFAVFAIKNLTELANSSRKAGTSTFVADNLQIIFMIQGSFWFDFKKYLSWIAFGWQSLTLKDLNEQQFKSEETVETLTSTSKAIFRIVPIF